MTVLFVTWDGPGTSYLESLFLPILARARDPRDQLHVLQYGWGLEEYESSIRATASSSGVPYTLRNVWRRPVGLGTAATIARGAADIVRYARRHEVDVLMPRAPIAAAMALLARRALPGVRLLYDADGLMADERVDFAGWDPSGRGYRALRAAEDAAVRQAEAILARTEWAVGVLGERVGADIRSKAFVVPNGRDAAQFTPGSASERAETRRVLGVPSEAPLLVYVGSLTEKYLPDRVAAFFGAATRADEEAHVVVLTPFGDLMNGLASDAGVPPERLVVRQVPHDEVAPVVAAADVGVAFVASTFSTQAVSAVKVGEYLLCGTPALVSHGFGDVEKQVDRSVGRVIDATRPDSLQEAAAWVVSDVLPQREAYRARARARGVEQFSLERSADQYRRAFDAVRPRRSHSGGGMGGS